MKLPIFIAFIVVAFLAYTAQAQRCAGQPRNPMCRGRRDEGYGGGDCRPLILWYYNPDNESCMEMIYRGCGGNGNRYCSKALCERRCRE